MHWEWWWEDERVLPASTEMVASPRLGRRNMPSGGIGSIPILGNRPPSLGVGRNDTQALAEQSTSLDRVITLQVAMRTLAIRRAKFRVGAEACASRTPEEGFVETSMYAYDISSPSIATSMTLSPWTLSYSLLCSLPPSSRISESSLGVYYGDVYVSYSYERFLH